jgi:hypothetical protein
MRTALVLTFAAALALPAAATAKGPDHALLSGPGISGSIRIDGDGEAGPGTPLGAHVAYGGYATQTFGHHPQDPTSKARPLGDLGPRYRIVYSVPTPDGRRSIDAAVYPYAIPRAVTYLKPGQTILHGMLTRGGWYVARPGLRRALVQAGLPDRSATGDRGTSWRWLGLGALGAIAVVIAAALVLRRRPQSGPAPVA